MIDINFNDIYGVSYKNVIYMLLNFDDNIGLFINTQDLKNKNITDNSYWKMSKRFIKNCKDIIILYQG